LHLFCHTQHGHLCDNTQLEDCTVLEEEDFYLVDTVLNFRRKKTPFDFHLAFNLRSHISLTVFNICAVIVGIMETVTGLSLLKGQSWSYGSWIYNYLCNQCLSPTKVWIRIPLMARCTRYNIMWKGLSVTCGILMVFSVYSYFLHQ
jgi:hypothetical protein